MIPDWLRDRPTRTARDAQAGCFVCGGTDAIWTAANAQAIAARHHDATGHPAWCDVYMRVRYGREAADDRQHDIEAAIAASSGEPSEQLPRTHPDAPADTAAGVSAPRAAQSRRTRSRPQPETAAP